MKKQSPPRIKLLLSAAVLAVASFTVALQGSQPAHADQISARSLTLQAGSGGDGGSEPGGTVNHMFGFTLPTGSTAGDTTDDVGSIKFQYCTTAAPVTSGIGCVSPTGINAASAALGSETGVTGFTGLSTANEDDSSSGTLNTVVLSKAAAADITAGAVVTYRLDDIVNPTAANETFFVRISTYNSLNGTGTAIDTGTVAAATASPVQLTGTMPESLVFCTGGTIGLTAGVPDCSTATSGAVSFDRLFSPTDTATATSQMAASTNAGAGYAVTVNGPTLTSGANTITPMGVAASPAYGVSQFGLNLKDNGTTPPSPDIGTEVAPAANGTNYRGQAVAGYNTVDLFKFADGNIVADSANGGPGGTDAQIFTASYIVNVPGSQPAGTYATTLTYICTPTF